jgi:hypothetical protein
MISELFKLVAIDRMIPPFEANGLLPPGIHQASFEEVRARFGAESEVRRVQMESVRWLLDLAKRARIKRIVINGSFVTDQFEPNDVDCVVLIASDESHDQAALEEIAGGLPFLDLQLVEQSDFEMLVNQFFATDRQSRPKGVVELIL